MFNLCHTVEHLLYLAVINLKILPELKKKKTFLKYFQPTALSLNKSSSLSTPPVASHPLKENHRFFLTMLPSPGN